MSNDKDTTNLVVITGGTGELGRQVVRHLLAKGHPVRVISRRPRPTDDTAPYQWATADLMTGLGLAEALAGATTVVHCARPREEVTAVRTLIGAAHPSRTEPVEVPGRIRPPRDQHVDLAWHFDRLSARGFIRSAMIKHLVVISIVGIDKIPFPYYRGKVAIEKLIMSSGLPYTILRTTQFHELLRMILAVTARSPIMPVFDLPFQSIDTSVAAARLAELAAGPPVGRAIDLGGPEVRQLPDLAREYLAITGHRRFIRPVRIPGAAFAAFRIGEHLTPEHRTAGPTFAEYLASLGNANSIKYGSQA